MQVNILSVSPISTNCYVLVNDENVAVVIDPGGSFPHIKAFIEKNKLTVEAILLTHGHHDHIGATYELKQYTGAKVYIHADDNEMLSDGDKCLAFHFIEHDEFIPIVADEILQDGSKFSVSDMEFTVMHTKGHTRGSCIFLCGEYIFTGDTLFKNSYGRTDLYGGSDADMRKSLKKISGIVGEAIIFPGHGQSTELAYEKLTNPLMGGSYDDIF